MSNNNPPGVLSTATTAPSTSSSTYSSYIELESQLILRMPYKKEPNGMIRLHPATATLREILDKIHNNSAGEVIDQDPLKDRLFIQLDPETRKGRVRFDDEVFEARLVDLPCIIESHKTLDKKAFFKSADISQMLVCKTQDEPWTLSDQEMFNSNETNKQTELRKLGGKLKKKYQWPHGITPPLKNVRKKRFRKLSRKKTLDYDDIEKELRELFKQDREAIRTEYEVIYLDRDPDEIEEEDEDDDDDEYLMQGRKRTTAAVIASTATAASITSRPNLHPIAEQEASSRADSNSSRPSTSVAMPQPARRSSRTTSRGEGSNLSASDIAGTLPTTSSSTKTSSSVIKKGQEESGSEKQRPIESGGDDSSVMDTKKDESSEQDTTTTKARTNFKNLFVKDVIGDLSSSDESEDADADEEDEDDEDYEENSKSKGPGTSSKMTKKMQSSKRFFTHDEDSMSNFDRSTRNYDDDEEEDEEREDEDDEEEDDGDENSRIASKTKEVTSKLLFGEESDEENDSDAVETEDEEEIDTFDDEDDDEKTRGSEMMSKTRAATTSQQNTTTTTTTTGGANLNLAYDLSLSSSDHNNTEMEASQQQQEEAADNDHLAESLSKLTSELAKIQEDRKKSELHLQSINNPVLKARLSSTLNNLIEEENKKLDEIAQLKSLMNK